MDDRESKQKFEIKKKKCKTFCSTLFPLPTTSMQSNRPNSKPKDLIDAQQAASQSAQSRRKLRRVDPYWQQYKTFVKARWIGRELLEILVSQFRERTKEYYIWAIHQEIVKVNGKPATARQVLRNGDYIENFVHRHESSTTANPIEILNRDDEKGILVISKPGGIPVQPSSRYSKNTLLELLKVEHGLSTIYTTNRLDRLTSGVMVCATSKETAQGISGMFAKGEVKKAYVCRVKGRFPESEITSREPILKVSKQCGAMIIHPLGKESETVFRFLSFDESTETSVVYCRPITGRTHQIRVHLQFLGYPILNDPIYNHPIFKELPPQSFKSVPIVDPDRWRVESGGGWLVDIDPSGSETITTASASPRLGSLEAVHRLTETLKNDHENQEVSKIRLSDEVYFGKLNRELGLEEIQVPGANGRSLFFRNGEENLPTFQEKDLCQDCKVPLLLDPDADDLFIYLHALEYSSKEWSYSDEMPWWAKENWENLKPNS